MDCFAIMKVLAHMMVIDERDRSPRSSMGLVTGIYLIWLDE